MVSTMLTVVFMLIASVQNSVDDRSACFYVEDEEGRRDSSVEQHCADSLTSITEMLKLTVLVSNSSKIIIEMQGPLLLNETVDFENFEQSTALTIDGQGNEIRCKNHESSGLYFRAVKNLWLTNFTLKHCGTIQESTSKNIVTSNSTVKFKSGIYILNCTNVSMSRLTIINNSGIGISFFDTVGKVSVTNSMFAGNTVHNNSPYPGGGGVYIEFTYCTPGVYRLCANTSWQHEISTNYLIQNCRFQNNFAKTLHPNRTSYVLGTRSNFQGFGRGGGLAIMFKGYHSGIGITISDCEFHNNTAYWGGGLYIMFRDKSNNNKVTIESTKFVKNHVKLNGGGGAKIGFLAYSSIDLFSNVSENKITMINCTFESNRAKKYGGGIAIVASKGLHNNQYEFINCKWVKNEALTASAVDISPGVWSILGNGMLPTPIFMDCIFEQNHIRSVYKQLGPGIAQEIGGTGTFVATRTPLNFKGTTKFINNGGTALYLTSAVVNVETDSNLVFRDNLGKNGGAIAMIAFSVLYTEDNTRVTFEGNTAMRKGGAIYTFSVETHLKSRSCFIQYKGVTKLKDKRHITFSFINNTAVSGIGHTLYTTSLSPCREYCESTSKLYSQHHINTLTSIDCVGHVHMSLTESSQRGLNIATQRGIVDYKPESKSSKTYYELVPGKDFHLPINTLDELEQSQARAFDIIFIPMTNNLSQSLITHRTSNNKINLAGVAGTTDLGILRYETYDMSVSVNVTISKCPPGYKLIIDRGECDCAQAHYKGLWKCDNSKMQAYILQGYWIGYCGDEICTAYCPMGFCSYESGGSAKENLLPSNAGDIEKYVCGVTRQGTLCTKCNHNYSVYFHSKSFSCRENNNCKYGILLYITSELLPLLAIFTFITVFDVHFTSGYLNGFILYAQMLDLLVVTARGTTKLSLTASVLTSIYQLIYDSLNLDFFDSFEHLSFCIWEGAEVMDVLAMKYVTILCALVLVIVTIFLWNTRMFAKLSKFSCCHHRTIKNAVIHGLSAFFVMCYSQCAKISFQILEIGVLYGYDSQQLAVVAFHAGDQKYFRDRHLIYAIPATTFLMILVAIPPILLLSYPLLFNILSKCNLSESKPILLLSRLIPMQLLDSFQSCFKDEYRFFAGLYFLYRIMILATSTFLPGVFYTYIIIEVELTIILALHSVVQPYKNSTHNKIDSVIFANLALINGLSIINYYTSSQENDRESLEIATILQASIYVQLILIYSPLAVVIAYMLIKAVHYTNNLCNKVFNFKKDTNWKSLNSTELPSLRDDVTALPNYHAFISNSDNSSVS